MVDWLYVVCDSLKMDFKTFEISIQIMDNYFYMTPKSLISSDLHLIGITSLWIATKYNEVEDLDIKTLKVNISHNSFTER